jgi:hypothetical protein
MSIGVFTDKNHCPSKAEIYTVLGKANSIWELLIQYIRSQFNAEEDFSFLYGKQYGWALRFRIKRKLLACIYPNANHFTTQIILNTQNISDTIINKLHNNASKAIEIATPYSEGK